MPYFSREFISEVMEKNDIADIVSAYTKLKKTGSTLKGLCPFHNEKTPSFSVSPDKQLFYCFGCGVGGTVLDFVMRRENLDFVDAVKYLAERARIDVPETSQYGDARGNQAEAYEKKQLLYRINSEAGRYYYNNLMSEAGREAQAYLINRQLSKSTINAFGIGYAKDEWSGVYTYLKEKGFTDNDIDAAGLVKNNNDGYFDRFRNRIMFPIIDIRGNVIGFGGRVLDDSKPKYLNSPETIIFNKSYNLFGINFAKNNRSNQMLIMEGYMDVISVHQHGIVNAVASLGTALTAEQAKMLRRYSKEVILCYDSDTAGAQAIERGIDVLREAGCKTKILQISGAKDPDEYISKKGVEMFKNLISEAKSVVEYKIGQLKAQYNLDDVEEKIEFIEKMAEVFAKMDNAVEREAYILKISNEVGISQDAILTEVRKIAYREERMAESRANVQKERIREENAGEKINRKNKSVLNAEKLLLNLLCDKNIYNSLKDDIKPDAFSGVIHKRVAEIIYDTYKNDRRIDPSEILSHFDTEASAVAEILLDDKNVDDKHKAAQSAVLVINQNIFEHKKEQLIKEGNLEKLQELLEEMRKNKGNERRV